MSGQRLAVESSAGMTADLIRTSNVRNNNADVSALASLDKNKLAVMVWHYYDDDLPGPAADVDLTLDGLPEQNGSATVTQYLIDADHSNSYEAWKRMGSPLQPTPEQYAQLEKAGQLAQAGAPEKIQVENGNAAVKIKLARQAVSLLVLEWN
jgi:xylan 1,4-beta-xylosidase